MATATVLAGYDLTPSLACRSTMPYSHLVNMPVLSAFLFEPLVFIVGLAGYLMQLCNIYKATWWLPYSDATYPIHIEHIDRNIAGLAVAVLLRRPMGAIWRQLSRLRSDPNRTFFVQGIVVAHAIPVLGYLVISSAFVYNLTAYPAEKFGYLLFPIVSYLLVFGFDMAPLHEATVAAPLETYPIHLCSAGPNVCRTETYQMSVDVNSRLKQIFFNSSVSTFYGAVIVLIVTPEPIFYSETWSVHIVLSTFLALLSLNVAYFLPCRYIDLLQRSASHLGRWKRLDSQIPAVYWSESHAWPASSVVRHNGRVYRALCLLNTAIPGSGLHNKFHAIFNSPSTFYLVPFGISLISTVYVLALLLFVSVEWHQVIGLAVLSLANCVAAFQTLRGLLVLWWSNQPAPQTTSSTVSGPSAS